MSDGSGPDVAIVGAGIVGLATALALRDRGVRVTIYERGEPGRGQSGGESRIFRHIHEDPRLVAQARRSLELWREWEVRFDRELVAADGVLSLGPDARQEGERLRELGIEVEILNGSELPRHLPLLSPWEGEALLDLRAGVIRSRAAIEALVGQLGDAVVRDEVLSVRPVRGDRIEVRAGDIRSEHDRAVVCAGRGTMALAHGAGLVLPIRHSAHVRLAFPVVHAPPERAACLLDHSGTFGESSVYGDPLPGNELYAIGLDESPVHADGGLIDPQGLADVSTRTVDYVAGALHGLRPEPVQARHCWVTELSWGHDAFAAWSVGGASFLVGNNLFKHAPAVGQALAAQVLGQPGEITLDPQARLGADREPLSPKRARASEDSTAAGRPAGG